MRKISPGKLALLAAGVFMFQMGGCAITDAIAGLFDVLVPAA